MSSFEHLIPNATAQMDALRIRLPGKIAAMDTAIETLFPDIPLVEVEKAFFDTINKGDTPNTATNDTVTKILQHTRQQLSDAVSDLKKFARWITLLQPPVEDGNNFGVGVQHEVLKGIKDHAGNLQGVFNALPGYYKDRAAAWKMLDLGTKVTTKASNSTSSEAEGKEDATTKKNSSNDTVSVTSNTAVLADAIAHVVSIDVQTYFHLKCVLEDVRDVLVAVEDCTAKNLEKIQYPKGKSGSNSSAMSMY